jgi:hypothetical protein
MSHSVPVLDYQPDVLCYRQLGKQVAPLKRLA